MLIVRSYFSSGGGSLTAQRRNGSVHWLNQDIVVVNLLEEMRLVLSFSRVQSVIVAHILAFLCIKQAPAQLNHFSRVLCDVNAVFVTGGSYMDDQVVVQLRGR